jgi:hypothetical protein
MKMILMKKITLAFLFLLATLTTEAQTIAWSSDSEDLTNWGSVDNDGDTFDWGVYGGGGESIGFTGALFFSQSWDGTAGALSPNNYLFTPVFLLDGSATTITYKMKVGSNDPSFFAEKFAVYVYDENDAVTPPELIYTETLSSGGDGTAKDITASIPISYTGKTIGLLIRHFDCTNQNQLLIDDFEVSYTSTLSTEENQLAILGVYPNPVKDVINIKTNEAINTITVSNQLGQQVMTIDSFAANKKSFDLTSLNKGLYFMTVTIANKNQSFKIIKE